MNRPPEPPRPTTDDILAKVDRLLKRDLPAAPPAEDVPTLSEVLVPGTHARSGTIASGGIDPAFEAKLVQAILREWLPVLEAKVTEDVRRRLVTEMSQALTHAVTAAVTEIRSDIQLTVEAAVKQAVRQTLRP
jgi:hypothetical protein